MTLGSHPPPTDDDRFVRVCHNDDLRVGTVRSRALGADAQGIPWVALVLRDADGGVHAYRNLCRHLAVPLDGNTGRFFNKKKTHLVCGTHGALYRLADGYCEVGPCEGLSLERLRWELRPDGAIYVAPPS